MQGLAITSFVTLGISMTTVGILNNAKNLLSYSTLKDNVDQTVRGLMLSFAIYHLGPELLEIFTIGHILALSFVFTILAYLLQIVYNQYNDQNYIQEKYPWVIYTLLIPHFIGEGFAIAPQASNSCISIVIAGFLIHKTLELTMLTASTNNQIHCKTQRKIIQTLFVIITPLSILSYSLSSSLLAINETVANYTEFLNFVVFVQLSTLCQFCPHNIDKKTNWVDKNKFFIGTFLLLSMLAYLYPGLLF